MRSLIKSLRALARACCGAMLANDKWAPMANSDTPATKKKAVIFSCPGGGGYDHNTIACLY